MEGESCGDGSNSKMEDYELLGQIGKGVHGSTFLLLHRAENRKYALKKIPLAKQTEMLKRAAYQEMNLNVKLRHPYIMEYKDAWVEKGSYICIITNYYEGGDMAEILKKSRGALFSEEKLCKWLTQMLLALDYLHSNRVLHRDLKLSNIFITKENDVRLGDFGFAKLVDAKGVTSSVVGTPNYICPELLSEMPYGYKSDIWSLGCCMFEIAGHQPPFRAPDMATLINKINRGTLSPLPVVYSSTLKQIIKTMLRKSPEHRPTAAELLRHQHLQAHLLRCQNLPSVFLPVKSPNSAKEKTGGKPSPSNSSSSRQRRQHLKDSIPIFSLNQSPETQPSSTSQKKGDLVIEAELETKRVDRKSCSPKISEYSDEESLSTPMSSSASVLPNSNREAANETPVQKEERQEEDGERECDEKTRRRNSLLSKLTALAESKDEWGNPTKQRADALESLLELCAQLIKQEKFDELYGVLKPFGEDAVSSRETAIWLTKTLMTSQKLPKGS
ncbi:unnamed protein product [Cuscuta campestris]|uniref:Protein kinase domain-containing protein n=1 Tax=Cuscuta campestris TaxID=132261 RepID=A0A484L7F9_9ASTE|nr:unnamed protein product [Cuscuta campestris]